MPSAILDALFGGVVERAAEPQQPMGVYGGQLGYIQEYRVGIGMPAYQMAAPPPRWADPVDSVIDLASNWGQSGLRFSEIVVPQATFLFMCHRLSVTDIPDFLNVHTATGPIKITCEDTKPRFDLRKYMETVE